MTSNSNLSVRSQSFLAAILAALLLVPLFAFRRIGGFDFWWWMSLNVVLLVSFALYSDKSYFNLILKDLREGLLKKIFFKFLLNLTQFKAPSLCKTTLKKAVAHSLFFQPVFALVSGWFRLIILSGVVDN